MQIIQFKEPAAWQEQVTLTGTIFILFFKWNALNKYWVMSIFDRNSSPILVGVKIVTNYDLTSQFVVSGIPQGDILCQNVLNEWNDIARFDMGETNELFYYEPNELQALSA
jgi:hypothetical protein